ncbi:MAG TPA: VanZ family protein [Spirochaetota bacterium]|nr:VanZ family protein [Spirochaetota bacterium]HPQ54893.1 VanZ family protein [Spirochaetota bacterium]
MRTVYSLVAVYLCVMYWIIIRYVGLSIRNFMVLTAFIALYAVIIVTSTGFDKKMHLIEYGLMTYLVFDALRFRFKALSVYILSLLLVMLIGVLDEILQYFAPGRSFDLGDLSSNVTAAVLMLALVSIVEWLRAGRRTDVNSLDTY